MYKKEKVGTREREREQFDHPSRHFSLGKTEIYCRYFAPYY
jgi:hypothetical protein